MHTVTLLNCTECARGRRLLCISVPSTSPLDRSPLLSSSSPPVWDFKHGQRSLSFSHLIVGLVWYMVDVGAVRKREKHAVIKSNICFSYEGETSEYIELADVITLTPSSLWVWLRLIFSHTKKCTTTHTGMSQTHGSGDPSTRSWVTGDVNAGRAASHQTPPLRHLSEFLSRRVYFMMTGCHMVKVSQGIQMLC